jgi:hypothetical protein
MARVIKRVSAVFASGTILYGTTREHKKIIVFDIDNTLIHAKLTKRCDTLNMKKMPNYDFQISLNTEDNDKETYNVWIRPFANIVIPLLSNFATCHIYTSAKQDYADFVLGNMPMKEYFEGIHYYDSWKKFNTKNLSVIPGNNKDKILVDDRNFNNANDGSLFYHIPSYRVHSNYDCELIKFFLKWMFVL